MIKLTQVSLRRGPRVLFDGADLSVHQGQRTGVTERPRSLRRGPASVWFLPTRARGLVDRFSMSVKRSMGKAGGYVTDRPFSRLNGRRPMMKPSGCN